MIHKSNQKITIMNKIMATRLTLLYLDTPKFLSVSQKMNITLPQADLSVGEPRHSS